MSSFMLDDDDAINDVNPFVSRDFSLPGGVRQTGDFTDFMEIRPGEALYEDEKSVYCGYGLCEEEVAPVMMTKEVHPKRNIDYGCTPKKEIVTEKKPVVGVAKKPRYLTLVLIILILLLLFFALR